MHKGEAATGDPGGDGGSFRRSGLRFECTRCGRCCTGRDAYVFLRAGEAEAIRRTLGLSRSWFRRRYLAWSETGDRVLAATADGRCVFLDARGRCRVYRARPLQCRTYPFWPELVAGRDAWERERARCEGIGRGPFVPRAAIEAALEALAED